MPWNPDLYNQFAAQRSAPFEDLWRAITVRAGMSVIDLGCGTGELTLRLADCLPDSHVVGLDSAPSMLERAQQLARPGLTFELGDLAHDDGRRWDLLFSHAAVQWVPDHPTLIPALLARIAPGGQVAIQMPANHNHPVQQATRDLAQESPFREALGGFVRWSPVLPPEQYADLLYEAGFTHINVFEKVYPYLLDDAYGVVEFTRGTMLMPYLERLPDETLRAAFLAAFAARVRAIFPRSPVFYGFKRILFTAQKPA